LATLKTQIQEYWDERPCGDGLTSPMAALLPSLGWNHLVVART
jgi:hypothetical protein